jgi:hypothetical protein
MSSGGRVTSELRTKVDKIVFKKTTRQRKMEALWFVFGNHGMAHSLSNHKYVQRHVEGRGKEAEFYPASIDCQKAVERVLESKDWTE